MPLELAGEGLNQRQLDALWAPFKQQVKERGLWAAHLPPEHGGCGMGQLRLALLHEVLGRSVLAPEIFGCQAPDSGNAELLAAGANEAQARRWLEPLLAGHVRSTFALTEPHNSGSDPTGITTRCERDGEEWVINGHKWFASNASVERLHDRDGGDRPRGAAAPACRDARGAVPPSRRRAGARRGLDASPARGRRADGPHRRSHRGAFRELPRAAGPHDRRAGRRFRAGAEAPRRRAHPPRDALHRAGRPRPRDDVRARRVARHPGQAAGEAPAGAGA